MKNSPKKRDFSNEIDCIGHKKLEKLIEKDPTDLPLLYELHSRKIPEDRKFTILSASLHSCQDNGNPFLTKEKLLEHLYNETGLYFDLPRYIKYVEDAKNQNKI